MPDLLIIEDGELTRGFLRELFERQGFDVREADNGLAGIDAFNEQPSDVVLKDLYMPEADGIEVLREIFKESQGAKIVAISGGTASVGRTDILQVVQDLDVNETIQNPSNSWLWLFKSSLKSDAEQGSLTHR